MPKTEGAPRKTTKTRHNPLAAEILQQEATQGLSTKQRVKERDVQRRQQEMDEQKINNALPSDLTKRVLRDAKLQMAEEDVIDFDDASSMASAAMNVLEEGEEDFMVDEEGFIFGDAGMTAEEMEAMQKFMPNSSTPAPQARTLADIILEKIKEAEAKAEGATDEETPGQLSGKVMDVYKAIGAWMKKYSSGPLPKAFKIIPSLTNWEEVLYLTNPVEWSACGMKAATKLFASNLNDKMAQRFYNLVLLPAVREDIAKYRRLNFNLYEALKKAMFKPAAWMKGILLPLAGENCTLQEAMIFGSILAKVRVPVQHSAAALIKLSRMNPWFGTTAMLMATLINKKHSLPYGVLTPLVDHFVAFLSDDRELPVVWHRAVLSMVQRYKLDLSEDHRNSLKILLRKHVHPGITPEIRRELFAPAMAAGIAKSKAVNSKASRKISTDMDTS
mmetsp:Transcript_50953/g.111626  ORF Transcript_50953/g.111626 Transcript_50953/m.111626 type:complete len:445 (+) Transcript_50953:124-1458(+)